MLKCGRVVTCIANWPHLQRNVVVAIVVHLRDSEKINHRYWIMRVVRILIPLLVLSFGSQTMSNIS